MRRRPAVLIVGGFGALTGTGTALLMLPGAAAGDESADFMTALFTSVSAVCVTGLYVVDTPMYWSVFGQVVVLCLMQLGGLGIMTMASVLSLLVLRRFGLRMQLTAQAETKTLGLGEVRRVLGLIVLVTALFESVVMLALTARLFAGYDRPLGRAAYEGAFYAVSAFNNGGFVLHSDNMMGFVADPWFCLPIIFAVIAGGLGFPVLLELGRRLRVPRRWSLHTKITVAGTAVLLVCGCGAITVAEWTNPATLGPLSPQTKLLAGFFAAVMPRSAGFNTVDIGSMYPATLLVQDVLMFIGGGSAGTAGGIKITTFALLAFVIHAEIRGEPTVHVMGRRLPEGVQRQALTIALLGVALVMTCTLVLLVITPFGLDQVLFEVVSAFATVGLSTGITPDIGVAGQALLVALMFIGRLGPITLASALALRERPRRYELPEERPIVG
ncbi:TrkH family potassium uptake protein [Saccharopolyspora erythraea]|uniref:Cation transporter n=2 Tax=Saccharopolyspora erythraea TaxID=1836 RepID=A4FBN1_SACEN|nr:potassium transporter TrkG [Saccharopolyspora erythraea]CAM01456.1 cation transporter [Saccharopolyspora erythraea NRRL 2338]